MTWADWLVSALALSFGFAFAAGAFLGAEDKRRAERARRIGYKDDDV